LAKNIEDELGYGLAVSRYNMGLFSKYAASMNGPQAILSLKRAGERFWQLVSIKPEAA